MSRKQALENERQLALDSFKAHMLAGDFEAAGWSLVFLKNSPGSDFALAVTYAKALAEHVQEQKPGPVGLLDESGEVRQDVQEAIKLVEGLGYKVI